MKIKDLIKELNQFNPETEVLFSNSIESFRSVTCCQLKGDLQILDFTKEELQDEYEDVIEEQEITITNDEYVVLEINGEETYSD
jgi:hypothetical protein